MKLLLLLVALILTSCATILNEKKDGGVTLITPADIRNLNLKTARGTVLSADDVNHSRQAGYVIGGIKEVERQRSVRSFWKDLFGFGKKTVQTTPKIVKEIKR